MEKGTFVAALTDNAMVDGIFVTSDVVRLSDKNGRPYWAFNLCDTTGSIQAKIWSQRGTLTPQELPARAFVRVHGQVSTFREVMQVRVDTITVLSEQECAQLDMAEFAPPSPYDGAACMDELMELVRRETAGTCWERLVTTFFADEKMRTDFINASAARSMHHAGRGGLAAHSLEVCKICLAMADLFPVLDRAILATSALFHDIGKLEEMHTDPFEVNYTVPGSLIGHIVLGISMLHKACEQAAIPAAQRDHFFHLLLSHHGRTEYGAVKEPSTMEAMVLSTADFLDAKLNTMQGLLDKVAPGELTALAREFGRSLYKPEPSRPVSSEIPASPAQAAAQSPARASQAPQPAAAPQAQADTESARESRASSAQRTRTAARRPAPDSAHGPAHGSAPEPGPLPDTGIRGSEMDMPSGPAWPSGPVWEDGYLDSLTSIHAGFGADAGLTPRDGFDSAAPAASTASASAAREAVGEKPEKAEKPEKPKTTPLLDLLK